MKKQWQLKSKIKIVFQARALRRARKKKLRQAGKNIPLLSLSKGRSYKIRVKAREQAMQCEIQQKLQLKCFSPSIPWDQIAINGHAAREADDRPAEATQVDASSLDPGEEEWEVEAPISQQQQQHYDWVPQQPQRHWPFFLLEHVWYEMPLLRENVQGNFGYTDIALGLASVYYEKKRWKRL